jgi:flagellar L-ring protein FlgH
MRNTLSWSLLILPIVALSGCTSLNRLGQVGEMQQLTQIRNPESGEDYNKVTMPMPKPLASVQTENSLWKAGARSFFKDQRAQDVGDILTITVQFTDQADFKNDSERKRDTTETIKAPNVLGYEKYLNNIFPDTVDKNNLVNFESHPTYKGHGAVKRAETLDVKVAATVTQLLPNGNLVVMGRQEIRVNNEIRELVITGVVRPQDIMATNTISYEKIAEARISYGGRGQISDIQQSPWGQQLLDVVSPF